MTIKEIATKLRSGETNQDNLNILCPFMIDEQTIKIADWYEKIIQELLSSQPVKEEVKEFCNNGACNGGTGECYKRGGGSGGGSGGGVFMTRGGAGSGNLIEKNLKPQEEIKENTSILCTGCERCNEVKPQETIRSLREGYLHGTDMTDYLWDRVESIIKHLNK